VNEQLREHLGQTLRPILQRYGVRRAILFGSMARGDLSRHSDVDLILVQETDKRFLDRYDGILAEITTALGRRAVDLLIYTPEELAAIADRPFVATALREGEVLYES
jgi:predicted nucleotidyltransferase